MIAYLILFAAGFLSATILPMQSEAVFVAMLHQGTHDALLLFLTVSVANVLGSVVNWCIGAYLHRFSSARWFPVSEKQLQKAENWYGKYGAWSLLLSWVPIVGDPLTVIAGMLRMKLWVFIPVVALAKAGRYYILMRMFGFDFG